MHADAQRSQAFLLYSCCGLAPVLGASLVLLLGLRALILPLVNALITSTPPLCRPLPPSQGSLWARSRELP